MDTLYPNHSLSEAIKADTFRQYGNHSRLNTLKGFFFNRHFRSIITLRLCQASQKWPMPLKLIFFPLFRVVHKISVNLASIDLPWETKIQPGLAITHGWGLVIAPGCIIESNVTLFHGVTLGRRDRITEKGNELIGYPHIKDGVWIGPNAIIVGAVTVGEGSRIAGGAFVTEDVPPYSLVIGNPSQIVKSGCLPDIPNAASQKDKDYE